MTATIAPAPWEFSGRDSAIVDDSEVTGLVGADGQPVLEIGWGGFSCESDPYGSYPLLEATDEHWALIKAAPDLLSACKSAMEFISKYHRQGDMIVGGPPVMVFIECQAAISKAMGEVST